MRVIGLPIVGGTIGRLVLRSPSREKSRKFWAEMLVARPEGLSDELLDVDVAHVPGAGHHLPLLNEPERVVAELERFFDSASEVGAAGPAGARGQSSMSSMR